MNYKRMFFVKKIICIPVLFKEKDGRWMNILSKNNM